MCHVHLGSCLFSAASLGPIKWFSNVWIAWLFILLQQSAAFFIQARYVEVSDGCVHGFLYGTCEPLIYLSTDRLSTRIVGIESSVQSVNFSQFDFLKFTIIVSPCFSWRAGDGWYGWSMGDVDGVGSLPGQCREPDEDSHSLQIPSRGLSEWNVPCCLEP